MKATLVFIGEGPLFVAEASTTQQVFDDMRQSLRRRWCLSRTTSIVFVRLTEPLEKMRNRPYVVYVSGTPVQPVSIAWDSIEYYPMDEDEREVLIPYVENPDEE